MNELILQPFTARHFNNDGLSLFVTFTNLPNRPQMRNLPLFK